MVAKISVGSSLFGALAYNQQKIDEGEGCVLCSNLITESEDGKFNIHSCMEDFNRQFPSNIRTEKPIVHISLNPHPDDKLTNEQLAEIAEEYLDKMGYGKQPYLIYKHEDIERHHVHIVTLGVDANGKKIDNSNNFYKSKKVLQELEKKYDLLPAEKQKQPIAYRHEKVNPDNGNIKRQVANVIKPLSARYYFQSFNEYKALLSLHNVTVKEVRGNEQGKEYNGLVYMATDDKGNEVGKPLKSSLFGKSVGYDTIHTRVDDSKLFIKDNKLRDKTKQIVSSTLRQHPDRSSFERELSKKGVDVLFRENDAGRIYGVTFIDHNNSCVFNGSRLGKEFSANAFEQGFSSPISESIESPSIDTTSPYEQQYEQPDDSLLGGILDIFSMESGGVDHEEEQFIRNMKKKKKKGRRL